MIQIFQLPAVTVTLFVSPVTYEPEVLHLNTEAYGDVHMGRPNEPGRMSARRT